MFSCEFWKISHNTFFKEPFRRLLPHKHSLCLLSTTNFCFFKTDVRHIFQLSSSIFQTLSQTPTFNPVKHLKTFWRGLENVLKVSWRRFCKTPWRSFENVLKTPWRRMAKTNILVLMKTSSENVQLRRIYSSWLRCLEEEDERLLQDVFIKTNGYYYKCHSYQRCVCCCGGDATELPSGGNYFWSLLV